MRLAVASLVVGLVCGGVGGGVLGLIFGIVALRQIKRNNQTGRGLAVAGIVLSLVTTAAAATALSVYLAEAPDPYPTRSEGRQLVKGDCLASAPDDGVVGDAHVVDCGGPHVGQVYAVVNTSGASSDPDETCRTNALGLPREIRETAQLSYFIAEPAKAKGRRQLVCLYTE